MYSILSWRVSQSYWHGSRKSTYHDLLEVIKMGALTRLYMVNGSWSLKQQQQHSMHNHGITMEESLTPCPTDQSHLLGWPSLASFRADKISSVGIWQPTPHIDKTPYSGLNLNINIWAQLLSHFLDIKYLHWIFISFTVNVLSCESELWSSKIITCPLMEKKSKDLNRAVSFQHWKFCLPWKMLMMANLVNVTDL